MTKYAAQAAPPAPQPVPAAPSAAAPQPAKVVDTPVSAPPQAAVPAKPVTPVAAGNPFVEGTVAETIPVSAR